MKHDFVIEFSGSSLWFEEMCVGTKSAEVDFDDFVICQFGYVKMYTPEFPFPLCFWLG